MINPDIYVPAILLLGIISCAITGGFIIWSVSKYSNQGLFYLGIGTFFALVGYILNFAIRLEGGLNLFHLTKYINRCIWLAITICEPTSTVLTTIGVILLSIANIRKKNVKGVAP
jgi:hypothetical protein